MPKAAHYVHPAVTSHRRQATYTPLPLLHATELAHNPELPLPVVVAVYPPHPVPPPAAAQAADAATSSGDRGCTPPCAPSSRRRQAAPLCTTYPCRTTCARASATPDTEITATPVPPRCGVRALSTPLSPPARGAQAEYTPVSPPPAAQPARTHAAFGGTGQAVSRGCLSPVAEALHFGVPNVPRSSAGQRHPSLP